VAYRSQSRVVVDVDDVIRCRHYRSVVVRLWYEKLYGARVERRVRKWCQYKSHREWCFETDPWLRSVLVLQERNSWSVHSLHGLWGWSWSHRWEWWACYSRRIIWVSATLWGSSANRPSGFRVGNIQCRRWMYWDWCRRTQTVVLESRPHCEDLRRVGHQVVGKETFDVVGGCVGVDVYGHKQCFEVSATLWVPLTSRPSGCREGNIRCRRWMCWSWYRRIQAVFWSLGYIVQIFGA
jgi:hypothetical protein